MADIQKEKTIRLSFTMKERYVSMLADLAEKDSGATLSHEVRRLIENEYRKQFGEKREDK